MNPDAPIVEIPEQKVIKSSPSHLVILFLVILGVAALSALGTYYYLLPQLKSNTPQTPVQYQQTTDQSNTNTDNMKQNNTVNQSITGTEGWKTYTNTAYTYSLKYPTDFSVKEVSPEYVRFFKGSDNPNLPTPETYFSVQVKPELKDISPDVTSDKSYITYRKSSNGTIFQLSSIFMGDSAQTQPVTKKIFDQILSTFKLTNQTQATPDDTAHSLIDAWLNSSKSLSTATQKKILDYTFTIANATLNGNVLQFKVDYSVKPVDINQTDWAAGNGQIDTAAGWIYHKTSFVLATNVNGVYTITKMATSPL